MAQSRPLSPLDGSVMSFRSGTMTARSIRSNCTGIHHKVPLLPWYKRDVFAGEALCDHAATVLGGELCWHIKRVMMTLECWGIKHV